MKKIWSLLLCLTVLLSACGSSEKEDEAEVEEEEEVKEELTSLIQFQDSYPEDQPVALMETDYGTIVIVLFPEYAPKAVENFSTHAKNGYYDGLTFHRVIQDFMIQGGDPTGDGTGGESIWGEDFEEEFSNQLYHFKGALAMARTQYPSSQSSQFYIVQSDNTDASRTFDPIVVEKYNEVGGYFQLDGNYTVFGQTIEGLDVVDAIAAVEVEADASGAMSKPATTVHIKTITMTTYGEYIASK